MKSYYHRSKSLANSFLFILPLLVLYEVGIAMQGSGIKNTADVVIKTPLLLFGKNGSLIFTLLFMGCCFPLPLRNFFPRICGRGLFFLLERGFMKKLCFDFF